MIKKLFAFVLVLIAVTGTAGTGTPHSIGTGVAYGDGGATEVGTVTIGGLVVGEISITPYTYKP